MKTYIILFILFFLFIQGEILAQEDSLAGRRNFSAGILIRPAEIDKNSELPAVVLSMSYNPFPWMRIEPFLGYKQSLSDQDEGEKVKAWTGGLGLFYCKSFSEFNLSLGMRAGYRHSVNDGYYDDVLNRPASYTEKAFFLGPVTGFEYRIHGLIGVGAEVFLNYSDIVIIKRPISFPYKDYYDHTLRLEGNLCLRYYF